MSGLTEQLAMYDIENPKSALENKEYWKLIANTRSESDKVLALKVLATLSPTAKAQAIVEASTADAAVKATYIATGNKALSAIAGITFGLKGTCYRCNKSVAFGSKCCGVYCMELNESDDKSDDKSDEESDE